jgi:hypothetical protein
MLEKGYGDRFKGSSQNPTVRKNEGATFKVALRKYVLKYTLLLLCR